MVETPDGVYPSYRVNHGEPPSHRDPALLSTICIYYNPFTDRCQAKIQVGVE